MCPFVLAFARMALRLIRRHVTDCRHTSTRYRHCQCPIHVYGTLGGEKIRKALDQASWEAATDLINAWTAAKSGSSGSRRQQSARRSGSSSRIARRGSSVGRPCGSTGIFSRTGFFPGPSGKDSTTFARYLSTPSGSSASRGPIVPSMQPRTSSGARLLPILSPGRVDQAESGPGGEATEGDTESDVTVLARGYDPDRRRL